MITDLQKTVFEIVELDGKDVLYTDDRIARTIVPKGMYRYEIRHGDYGVPMMLKQRVDTSFGGTILTNELLDVGDGMLIDGSLIFTGCEQTLSGYLEDQTVSGLIMEQ